MSTALCMCMLLYWAWTCVKPLRKRTCKQCSKHMHKAVAGRVEVKMLLSCRRQSEYSLQHRLKKCNVGRHENCLWCISTSLHCPFLSKGFLINSASVPPNLYCTNTLNNYYINIIAMGNRLRQNMGLLLTLQGVMYTNDLLPKWGRSSILCNPLWHFCKQAIFYKDLILQK